MAFSDKYLATGSWDYTVNLIEIQSKTIYHKFDNIHSGNNNNNKYIAKLIPFIFINFILTTSPISSIYRRRKHCGTVT